MEEDGVLRRARRRAPGRVHTTRVPSDPVTVTPVGNTAQMTISIAYI